MDLARHIQTFWTKQAFSHHFLEKRTRRGPGASDEMRVPPPTSPTYFLPSHVEVCEEPKVREVPLGRAVNECSKKSMSQVLTEGLGLALTTQLTQARVVRTVLYMTRCRGIQPPALMSSIPEADMLKLGTLLQSRLKETRPSGGSPDRFLEMPEQPLYSRRGEWISKPLLNHKAFTLFLKSSHLALLGHPGVPRCGPYF